MRIKSDHNKVLLAFSTATSCSQNTQLVFKAHSVLFDVLLSSKERKPKYWTSISTFGSKYLYVQCLNMRREPVLTQDAPFNFNWTTHSSDFPTSESPYLQFTGKKVHMRSQKPEIKPQGLKYREAVSEVYEAAQVYVVWGYGFQPVVDLYFLFPHATYFQKNMTSLQFNFQDSYLFSQYHILTLNWSKSCGRLHISVPKGYFSKNTKAFLIELQMHTIWCVWPSYSFTAYKKCSFGPTF